MEPAVKCDTGSDATTLVGCCSPYASNGIARNDATAVPGLLSGPHARLDAEGLHTPDQQKRSAHLGEELTLQLLGGREAVLSVRLVAAVY
jgi:hypothetical protein